MLRREGRKGDYLAGSWWMLEDGVSDALRAKLLANCPILNCFDSGCFPPEVLSARHALAGPLPTLISSEHR